MDAEGRAETPQEVFDITYRGLRDRGWTKAEGPWKNKYRDGLVCKYRSEVGPCAFGFHILDSEYKVEWDDEAKSSTHIINVNASIREWVTKLFGDLHKGIQFMRDLQQMHDNAEPKPTWVVDPDTGESIRRDWHLMENRLKEFARRHNLTIPDEEVVIAQ